MPRREFMTIEQLADRWHMSPQSIRNRRTLGHPNPFPIVGIKTGQRLLFPLDKVEEYERLLEATEAQRR